MRGQRRCTNKDHGAGHGGESFVVPYPRRRVKFSNGSYGTIPTRNQMWLLFHSLPLCMVIQRVGVWESSVRSWFGLTNVFFYSQMAPPLMWQERPQFASWSKFDVHACHFCIVFDSLWMIIGKNPPRQMCVLSMKSYPLSRSPHINSAHDLSEEEIDIRLRKSSRRLFARNWHGTVVFTESSSSRKKNWW